MIDFREQFLRRYAATPNHIPRLERLLSVYGADQSEDAFAAMYLAWDDEFGAPETGRLVGEWLVCVVDADGRLVRVSDAAVRGALRLMGRVRPAEEALAAAALRRLDPGASCEALQRAQALLESAAAMEASELESLEWMSPAADRQNAR
jgi:hypothetical protein